MVDDGSTDSSAAIAERFAAQDDRFRLLRRPNGGLSRARNTGVAASRGELVLFLGDDMAPASLSLLSEHVRLHAVEPRLPHHPQLRSLG